MKRIISTVHYLVRLPLGLFQQIKKIKFDTFLGGLIFGAIFSLFVNIMTVKIQGNIDRQRVLEALEREITYHLLDAGNVYSEFNRISEYKGNNPINADLTLSKKFSTRIWDNTEAAKYLLELDPNTASNVEVYYEVTVKSVNNLLQRNLESYIQLHKSCEPFYKLLTNNEPQSIEYCNLVTRDSLQAQAMIVGPIVDNIKTVKELFRPTQKRLQSPFLKLLMGDKSVEILK